MYKNKISIYRKYNKLTLSELAKKVGVSSSYLCHLEHGTRTNPSTEVMENIAIALNSTVYEIFFSE